MSELLGDVRSNLVAAAILFVATRLFLAISRAYKKRKRLIVVRLLSLLLFGCLKALQPEGFERVDLDNVGVRIISATAPAINPKLPRYLGRFTHRRRDRRVLNLACTGSRRRRSF
jgi:hypothetical protein